MIKIELNKFSAIGIVVFVKAFWGTMSRMKKFRKW